MSDHVSRAGRSRIMRAVGTKNTGPEMIVRRLLFQNGFRYRLHRKDLPGTPDIVFPSRKKAIFINGCFWHGHPGCPKGRPPKSRQDYWVKKIECNTQRDLKNSKLLQERGWQAETVWQCQLKNSDVLIAKLKKFLGS